MRLFLIIFILISSFLYARENPFLPDYYDKSKIKGIKIREKKGGEKIITKRIFLNKNVKKINKIIIEYEDKEGRKTIQSIKMNNFNTINNYIDISQTNKPVKSPEEYNEEISDKHYKRYFKEKKEKELEEKSKNFIIKPFTNVR